MLIRLTSASLWFIAIGWASNFADAFAGVPAIVGLAVAAAVAALIAIDPRKVLSPAQAKSAIPSTTRRVDLSPVSQTGR